MWPFPKKPEAVADRRVWNENWKVGDTAELVSDKWAEYVKPWERLPVGTRAIVTGFSEGLSPAGNLHYFLHFAEWPRAWSTNNWRKVRPVASEQSEVVQRILKAKPGKDIVREDA